MRNFVVACLAAYAGAKQINLGPITSTGSDIAIVWIQGAMCNNAGYESIAAAVQAAGKAKG
jgi:hypothetical protein